MKYLRFLLLLIILPGVSQGQNILKGSCFYGYNYFNLLDSCEVFLYDSASLIATTMATPQGQYKFVNITADTVYLKAQCYKHPGAINAADAVMVLASSCNLITLTPFQKLIADVNCSGGTPNPADALAITRYMVGQIPGFQSSYAPPGCTSSKSETIMVTMPATGVVMKNIRILFTGDVNGDFIP